MGKKKTRTGGKKLSIKKQTLRTLTNLTDDELRNAAGGALTFERPPTVSGITYACPPGTDQCFFFGP